MDATSDIQIPRQISRDAEQRYRAEIKRDPYSGAAYNDLGVSLLAQGKLSEAAELLETARRLLPDVPHPRVNLGLVYYQSGKLGLAREAAESALAVDPDCKEARRLLVTLRSRGMTSDDALERVIESVERDDPDSKWRQFAREQREVIGR